MTLIKSISGIRGIINTSIDSDLVRKYIEAFSNISPKGSILLARDTRNSGEAFISNSINQLSKLNRNYINCDIVPTPTAQYIIKSDKQCAGGIVFTASHNPSNWNGMKFIDSNGTFLDHDTFSNLEKEVSTIILPDKSIDYDKKQEHCSLNSISFHIKSILNLDIVDSKKIKKKNTQVASDSVNGATCIAMPLLLEKLNCKSVKVHSEYNEVFGRNPEPTPSNLADLSECVIKNGVDIGLATDPDGDRLSLVDDKGCAIGEEMTLSLCVYYILKYFPEKRNVPVVTNLSTTMLIDFICQKFNTQLIRTSVGEINVVKEMEKKNSVIGGEGNGGVILNASHLGRDSLVGAALILNLLVNENKTLSDICSIFPKFYIEKSSIKFDMPYDDLINKIKTYFCSDKISNLDGIKVIRKNEWIHIRKSNTEPIIRIIAESTSTSQSKKLIQEIKELV